LPRRDPGRAFGQDAEGARELQEFAAQLEPLGLTLKDVEGDGNCLFRALSDQLSGAPDGPEHAALRAKVVAYIRDHRADFEPFVEAEGGETFDQYVDKLGRDGVYAGHWALVAFSRLYEMDVCIHQLGQPVWWIAAEHRKAGAPPRAAHLAYYGWEHYTSVRLRDGPHEGPAAIPYSLGRLTTAGAPPAAASKKKPASASSALSWKETTIMNATGCQYGPPVQRRHWDGASRLTPMIGTASLLLHSGTWTRSGACWRSTAAT